MGKGLQFLAAQARVCREQRGGSHGACGPSKGHEQDSEGKEEPSRPEQEEWDLIRVATALGCVLGGEDREMMEGFPEKGTWGGAHGT